MRATLRQITHQIIRRTILRYPSLSLGLLLAGCASEPTVSPGPPRPAPLIIGHAGSGFFTPLNPFNPLPPSSLRSILRALEAGADGVEVDVRLSLDSIPVLYHDDLLEHMSTGRGCVSQTPAATLTRLRYRGGWPYDWFHDERLQRLDTVLRVLSQRPTFPYLHLDLHEGDPCAPHDGARSRALVRALARLLRRYQVPLSRVLILTDRSRTLHHLARHIPGVELGLEVAKTYEASMRQLQALPEVRTVVLRKDKITPARVEALRARGLTIVAFGGRSAAAVGRVVAAGPDAYQVDDVEQMRATLRDRAAARRRQSRP